MLLAYMLCLVALLLAQFPGTSAAYVRNRVSTTSSNGRGYGTASISARQKNQDNNEDENKPATFFVNDKQEVAAGADEEETAEGFFDQETDLPTGVIPTTSPAPTESASPTESPSLFPSDGVEVDMNSTAVFPPATAKPSSKAPTAPVTGPPSLSPGSTAAPVISSGVPTTAPPTQNDTMERSPTQSPTYMPTSTLTSGPTTASSFDYYSELVNYTTLDTVNPTNDLYLFNDSTTNNDTLLSMTDDFVQLLDDMSGNGGVPIPPDDEQDWTKVTIYPSVSPGTTGLPTWEDPQFPVSGQLSLRLDGITSPFDGDTRLIFLAAADEYIASAAMGHVQDIKVLLMYQRVATQDSLRKLQVQTEEVVDQQAFLQVDLGVEGLAFDEMLSAREWNMWLYDLFEQEGPEFVTMVQDVAEAESDTFFESLTQVQALDPDSAILAPSLTPTNVSIVMPPPMIASSNQDSDSGNDNNEEGTPLVAIIGAAVGGCLLIFIGIILIRYVTVLERKKQQASSSRSSGRRSTTSLDDNFGGAAAKTNNKKSSKKSSNSSTALQTKPSAGESIVSSSSYLTSGTNNFNTVNAAIGASSSDQHISAAPSESDMQSHMGGTTNGDMSVMDNMSYAYSLEPGIEPSVAGFPQSAIPSSAASAMSYSIYPGGSSVASLTSGTSSFGFMKLAMGNRGGKIPGGGISGKPTKDVLAPPGKLGIVIDTTLDGPVVHKVNPGSALEGKLKSGDIIVAIDGVDTRAMTAASITALMVKTANQRRKLTIITP
jgi:PDZ domain